MAARQKVKSSTAPVQVVKIDKSAAAVAERKKSKKGRQSKLAQIRQKARQDYKTLTPKEKQHLMERNIFTQAIRHGASEAEAKQEVMKYRKRRKLKASGKHATEQRKAIHGSQKEIRQKLKADLEKAKDVLKSAKEKNKSIKGRKERAAANAKATDAYQKVATKIANARAKATDAKKAKLATIHDNLQKVKKVFKKPTVKKGVRLVSGDKEAAPEAKAKGKGNKQKRETAAERKARKAAEAAPGYGPQISKNRLTRRNNQAAKESAEKAAAAPEPKKRGRKPKPKAEVAAPAAEAAPKRGRGRPPKPKAEVAAPAAEAAPKRGRGRPPKPKAEVAAPAAEPKKRGRPAKPKAEAAPAAEAGKKGGIRRRG